MINLAGKKGLVVGIANEHSIAYGCAQAFAEGGAKLAISYLNDKAIPFVKPLADKLSADIFMPLDVEYESQMTALFAQIDRQWGDLDFLVHSIAFAPKIDLHGRVVDCSLEGFLRAMNISCHSFIRLAKHAEPLMKKGGCLLTMSYLGADEVVQNYGLMGPVKSALQTAARYMASELGEKGIRVHVLSPGPLLTRAASGLKDFDHLMASAIKKSPLHKLVSPEDIGGLAAYLVSDMAKSLTGSTIYVDGGYHVVG